MSEVNLQALGEKSQNDVKPNTAMQEINSALEACGFGLFHIRLLCSAFFGLVSGMVLTNTTPYILPIAECDLDMNLVEKGLLNASPYVGMILVSIVGGFLTDTFGRKLFLVLGFGGISLFTILSGLSQSYIVLIITKFCEGTLFGFAFTPVVTLTSEFLHNGVRDRILLFQSSFASVSQVVVALMSWAILPMNWGRTFFNGYFELHTWNYYLLIMSLWSLTASIMYILLPDSPKYCITQRRYDQAREILISVYRQNTRKPADTFPFKDLWKDKSKLPIDEAPERKSEATFSRTLAVGLHNVKPMFQRPLGPYVLIFSTTNFFIMMLYNVIRLWFPQLSTIVEHYSSPDNPGLCQMLDAYTADLQILRANVTENDVCIPHVSGTETYINSIVLGSVCIVPYIISGVLVNKVGKKNLYIACGSLCAAGTLGLRWTSSKIAMVALFSSDVALAQIMMSLNQFLVVDLFPTTTRSLAIAITMTLGRIGSLVGNVLFPILLDMGCVVPFFSMAGTMICVVILSLFIPTKTK